jgi:hypothetical protein
MPCRGRIRHALRKEIGLKLFDPLPRRLAEQLYPGAIIEAAAGGTGVIVVDNRWMKSMTVGQNRDRPTADLLKAQICVEG